MHLITLTSAKAFYMALHLAWWVHRVTLAKQMMCGSVTGCSTMLSCRSVLEAMLLLVSLGMLPSQLKSKRASGPESREATCADAA